MLSILDDDSRPAALDAADPLKEFRAQFSLPAGRIYLDGNSLGPACAPAEKALARVMAEWRALGIEGWLKGNPPWFSLAENSAARLAPLLGAPPDSLALTASTTVNLHALLASFYRPAGKRTRIISTALDFPSDQHALASQIAGRGLDPARELIRVAPRVNRMIAEDDLIAAMDESVALALLPGVLFQTGQLLDMEKLAAAARVHGVILGLDLAHSIGAVPHSLEAWGVDFAVWCNYKYLNGGPGATGGLFVHPRHLPSATGGRAPALQGWWGSNKAVQFDMAPEFFPAPGAGAWQLGTPNLFSLAPLAGALELFEAAGLDNLRKKSLALTDYLFELIAELAPHGYGCVTPREHSRRGGHLALTHAEAPRIAKALKARGVIPDFRPPDIIRLAPAPLYTTFRELLTCARHLRAIVETRDHENFPAGRDAVA